MLMGCLVKSGIVNISYLQQIAFLQVGNMDSLMKA